METAKYEPNWIEKHIYTHAVFMFDDEQATIEVPQQDTNNPNNYNVIEYITGLLGWLIDNEYIVSYASDSLYWIDLETEKRASFSLI